MIDNLRHSFRVLALARPRGESLELDGVSIASPGVAFQMFNAAFLNRPVESPAELRDRLWIAGKHFADRGLPWSFWCCDSWLSEAARRRLVRVCEDAGLRLASEMPGMETDRLEPPQNVLPRLDIREVKGPGAELRDFRHIGSSCFRVPEDWFSEVFDGNQERRAFSCQVGYLDGQAVGTAATVVHEGVVGIYNVATLPQHRGRRIGEVMTREAAQRGLNQCPGAPVVLQSTSLGLSLYEQLGFRAVTRVIAFNSGR